MVNIAELNRRPQKCHAQKSAVPFVIIKSNTVHKIFEQIQKVYRPPNKYLKSLFNRAKIKWNCEITQKPNALGMRSLQNDFIVKQNPYSPTLESDNISRHQSKTLKYALIGKPIKLETGNKKSIYLFGKTCSLSFQSCVTIQICNTKEGKQ